MLGVISNTHDQEVFNLTQIRMHEDGGTADTGLLNILHYKTVPYYEFFAVSGAAGDKFIVSGIGQTYITVTGVTFESVPEPSTLLLLLLGAAGLFNRSWIRKNSARRV